jgi:hypothetical protein
MSPKKSSRADLKAVNTPAQSQINQDRDRVMYLAACIYPGDGFRPSEHDDIAQMLLELASIIAKYDEQEDREFLTYAVAEAIYPTTFEGQGTIQAYLDRASAGKYAGAQKGRAG